jgi:hypothetical protein
MDFLGFLDRLLPKLHQHRQSLDKILVLLKLECFLLYNHLLRQHQHYQQIHQIHLQRLQHIQRNLKKDR